MMQAKEIMTKEVVTVSGSATVAEAVATLKEKGLRALIVEPRYDGDPYGMVTETDIVYKVASNVIYSISFQVYVLMSKPCIVFTPDLGADYVARFFAKSRIRRAPVIQNGLLGVISISDILKKSDFVEKPKSDFDRYCEENPGAREARMYDD